MASVAEVMSGGPQAAIDVVGGIAERDMDRVLAGLTPEARWTLVGRPDRFPLGGTKPAAETVEMLRGALMTLAVSLSSMALGLAFGTLGAAAKLSAVAPARWLAEGYTTVVRGVPELLVIYLLFFGGNGAAMFMAGMFGYHGYIELNAFSIGPFAVGVVSGAYSTEVIRGAVLAVPVTAVVINALAEWRDDGRADDAASWGGS